MVTADGTYATQSALLTNKTSSNTLNEKPLVRKTLLDGDFFVASALGTDLDKLILRYANLENGNFFLSYHLKKFFYLDSSKLNKLAGEALLILASIIHLGKSRLCKKSISEDDLDRLSISLQLIVNQWPGAFEIFLKNCRASLELMLMAKGDVDRHEDFKMKKTKIVQVCFLF